VASTYHSITCRTGKGKEGEVNSTKAYAGRLLTYLTASRPLSVAATSASAAERRARVLPMIQSSDGLQSLE
jgi:hypothetical protein